MVHLVEKVAIPVRTFNIEVTNELPAWPSLDLPLGTISAPVKPGAEAYFLAPAQVTQTDLNPLRTVTYSSPTPANITDPRPELKAQETDSLPGPIQVLLGKDKEGAVFKVAFSVDDPPEEAATVEWAIPVKASQPDAGGGTVDITSDLIARLELEPHFRLELSAGVEEIAAGAPDPLELTCTNGVLPGNVEVIPPEDMEPPETDGPVVKIKPMAGAATGTRQVLVTDAGDESKKARRTIRVT